MSEEKPEDFVSNVGEMLVFIIGVVVVGSAYFLLVAMPGHGKADCVTANQEVRFTSRGTGYEYSDEVRFLSPGHHEEYYGEFLVSLEVVNEGDEFIATFRTKDGTEVQQLLSTCVK